MGLSHAGMSVKLKTYPPSLTRVPGTMLRLCALVVDVFMRLSSRDLHKHHLFHVKIVEYMEEN